MAKKPKRLVPKGYDFGTVGSTLLVANLKFIEDLRQAEVVACAYGFTHSPETGCALPIISLGALHEQPLVRAFAEFTRWQQESHCQAVELTFVFLAHGGYLLGLGNRHEAMARSIGRFSLQHDRLFCGATYVKQIDTRDPWLDSFREYRRQRLIAPFLLDACIVPAADVHNVRPHQLRRAETTEPLLNFQAEIVDEPEAESREGTTAWHVLRLSRQDHPLGQKPPRSGPRDVFARRSECLGRHFPVTLERVRTTEPYHSLTIELERRGMRRWQIEQALCNLVLSQSLCDGRFHYAPIRTGHLANEINEALVGRIEEADSKGLFDRVPDVETIVRQAELDANALFRANSGDSKGASLPTVQRLLEQKGLLDEN